MSPAGSLFHAALACLVECDAQRKVGLARQMEQRWRDGELSLRPVAIDTPDRAGLPEGLTLVHPRHLKRRSFSSEAGRLTLIHALAHIEFNAINLACDAMVRYRSMPEAYYADWVRVAKEEAEHFSLLSNRLARGGVAYGDYPAHSGLWDMALRSASDPLQRMALVPRMLEARGLDVTPGMIRRFREADDEQTAAALEVILREEVGHVEIGDRWFRHLCAQRGLDPESTYFELAGDQLARSVRGPLNREARLAAGFSEAELQRLETLSGR